MVWQQIDRFSRLANSPQRSFTFMKDARDEPLRLDEAGILATPLEYHTPKLPGLGDIDWGLFFSALGDSGYQGPVCAEVEDRAYEGTLETRKAALLQCRRFLSQFTE